MIQVRSVKVVFIALGIASTVAVCVVIFNLRGGPDTVPAPITADHGKPLPTKPKNLPKDKPGGSLAGGDGRESAAPLTAGKGTKSNPIDDPAVKARMKESLVVGLQNVFGPLFLENGLSEEQAAEACALMVTQQMEMFNLLRPRPGGPPPPIQDVEHLRTSQQDQLREKLGEKAYAALNQFNRDKVADRLASRLDESARQSGVALSGDQFDQIKGLLAKERVSHLDVSNLPPINFESLREEMSGQPVPLPAPPATANEDPVLQDARSILTSEQLRLLENVLKTRSRPPPRRR